MGVDLKRIEQAMHKLWTNKAERELFLSGKRPEWLDENIASEIDPRGVERYASLIRIGQHDLMNSIYPGVARLLGERWSSIVDAYFEKIPPAHFNLNRSAAELARYIREYRQDLLSEIPFIAELADYEWEELEVMECQALLESYPALRLETPEDFTSQVAVINKSIVLRTYEYPIADLVDKLREEILSLGNISKKETHLAIFRTQTNNRVEFLELSNLALLVVTSLMKCEMTVAELIGTIVENAQDIAPENSQENVQTLIMELIDLIQELQRLELVLGGKSQG